MLSELSKQLHILQDLKGLILGIERFYKDSQDFIQQRRTEMSLSGTSSMMLTNEATILWRRIDNTVDSTPAVLRELLKETILSILNEAELKVSGLNA